MKENKANKKQTKISWFPIAMLGVIGILPVFMTSNYYQTVCCQAMLYAIVALGLNFIVGLSGLMTLGTAAIYGMGAYTSALACTKFGLNPWLALVPVLIMGWLIGQGLGYPSLRVQGVYLSLATIGFNEIVRTLLTNLEWTGSGTGIRNIEPYRIGSFAFDTQVKSYYLIYIVLLIFIVIAWKIVHSRWGRAFIAVKDNPEALQVCGIDIAHVKITAFTLSSVFAVVAGAMYAHFNRYITPATYTTDLSISFVVMLIIGGLGNFWGCIYGAYIVAFLPQLLRPIGLSYKLIYALIMMCLVVFFPNGLLRDTKKYLMRRKAMKGGVADENRAGSN
ncbi:MAG: branched-chain amino acid ABC transporter permease [Lachnospiraceae bacterium]|nr:branched-chain amino acid ABC transporter permease [Lachnospiraceae bacterium]